MRVLAITKIFPNRLEPLSSPFNRQQLKELGKRCELTVLAAIPFVPGARLTGLPPRAAKLAGLPSRDVVDGVETLYVRQLYLPKLGVPVAVPLYLASLAPFRALGRSADVVFATWAYPDACAAVLFARTLGKPCVFKVHGSDLNVIARRWSARSVMRRVLPLADGAVTVSRALGEELASLEVPKERVTIVPNGVDAAVFHPRGKAQARAALGIAPAGSLVVFVGRLEPQKGVSELLRAFELVRAARPDVRQALVGDGVMRREVDAIAQASGGALLAPGARPLGEVADWLAACDVFTLPSWAEGTPNAVLEALASGRPVVASSVGGIPDVLADPAAGRLLPPRDAGALARALEEVLASAWDPLAVQATGPGSWAKSASLLHAVLARACAVRSARQVESSTDAISGGTTP